MSWDEVFKNKAGPLTPEMLEEAQKRILETGYIPTPRIISTEANRLLKKIHEIEPGWDGFTCSTEIYWKAKELGVSFP